MAKPDKPKKPTAASQPTPTQEAIDEFSYDIPFGRTIRTFFIREGKAVKNGWFAVLVIVVITIYLTHSWTAGDVANQISTATNYFGGELSKNENEISNIKGQLAEVKQERDKYQMMLAPFEAMAIAKYTNAPLANQLDLLANEMGALQTNTESLSSAVAAVTSRFPSPHPLISKEKIQSAETNLVKSFTKSIPIGIVVSDSDKSAFDLAVQIEDLFTNSGFTNIRHGVNLNSPQQYGIQVSMMVDADASRDTGLIQGMFALKSDLSTAPFNMIFGKEPGIVITIGKY